MGALRPRNDMGLHGVRGEAGWGQPALRMARSAVRRAVGDAGPYGCVACSAGGGPMWASAPTVGV